MCIQAEELMRKIEKEEEQISYEEPDKKVFHLCIVNLVIGYVQYFYIIVLNQPMRTIITSIKLSLYVDFLKYHTNNTSEISI